MKRKLAAVAVAALAPVVAMMVYNEVALRTACNEEVRQDAGYAARPASWERKGFGSAPIKRAFPQVAKAGVDAMMKREGDVVSGWRNKLQTIVALGCASETDRGIPPSFGQCLISM